MKSITINLDDSLYQELHVATQLTNETTEEAINYMIKEYVKKTFEKVISSYSNLKDSVKNTGENKAVKKIPMWAIKPTQVPHKIIRAYLQLAENDTTVTYNMLKELCSSPEMHFDVYVPTFESNFTQMKFDSEKSYGHVFDIKEEKHVVLCKDVEIIVDQYKEKFLLHSTDVGFINDNNQKNIGKTNENGTDHMQYFYKMKCLNCNNEYKANGSDIHLKKCPKCQGGADTGKEVF